MPALFMFLLLNVSELTKDSGFVSRIYDHSSFGFATMCIPFIINQSDFIHEWHKQKYTLYCALLLVCFCYQVHYCAASSSGSIVDVSEGKSHTLFPFSDVSRHKPLTFLCSLSCTHSPLSASSHSISLCGSVCVCMCVCVMQRWSCPSPCRFDTWWAWALMQVLTALITLFTHLSSCWCGFVRNRFC